MSFFAIGRRDRASLNRNRRELQPLVESFEPRQLLSSATISGTVFNDLTGNGASSDDTARSGVTIDLYQKGSSTVLKSMTTDGNGNFSFTGLSSGSYSLKQVVPSNSLATEALDGYSISLKSGQNLAKQNFDDFQLLPRPSLSQVHYTVTTPAGKTTTVSTLDGNLQQGDTVTATFDLKTAEQMTLVAYTAPNNDFDTKNLQEQVIYTQASVSGKKGTESLTVTVPNGYFQVDFVAGPAIDHLASNTNVLYHAQDRFIDGQQGGTQVNVPNIPPTGISPSTPANSTSSPTVAPVVTMLSVDADVASPEAVQARKH